MSAHLFLLKAVKSLLLFMFLMLQVDLAWAVSASNRQVSNVVSNKKQVSAKKQAPVKSVLNAPSQNLPEWRYSLRPGDNLIRFADRYLINADDWRTLQTLNNITDPRSLRFGQVLRVPLTLLKQAPASAEVMLANGKAGILKFDNSVQAVTAGQQLGAGTVLITGDNSKLNIKLADGSIVSMQPNSTLTLDTLSMYSGGGMVDTTLRLQQGKLEAEANPAHVQGNQLQIITPTAIAAVRGTKFRVASDDISIRQETLEGKVGLIAAGEEIGVAKGYGSLSEGGAAPLPPVLLLPAPATDQLPNQLDTVPVRFNLQPQEGAVAWVGKVSPDVQFNQIAAVNQGVTLNFVDLPDGHYYLKVRAKDQKGLEGYDATHEFTLHARPFAPTVNAPAKGALIRNPKPELTWTAVEQAKTYQLELANDAGFKSLVERRQVTNNIFKLEQDLQPGQYFWRLASVDGDNQGPYMPTAHFTYKALPPAPDVSQLSVQVQNNAVFVQTLDPVAGLRYQATLHNEKNQQKNVWHASNLGGEFNFLLKEYGKQTLILRQIEADGTVGQDAKFEFEAPPP